MINQIGRILSFRWLERLSAQIRGTTVDQGGANVEIETYQQPGDDAAPLPGDYAAMMQVNGTGRWLMVGALDPKNQGTAKPGERRVYGRNTNGSIVCEIHLTNDGSVRISNSGGSINMGIDGTVNINGAIIDSGGNIVGATVATQAGIDLDSHVHGGVKSGSDMSGPAQ